MNLFIVFRITVSIGAIWSLAAPALQVESLASSRQAMAKVKGSEQSLFLLKVKMSRSTSKDRRANPSNKAELCETAGRPNYERCMAGPDPDRNRCLREYDQIVLNCAYPASKEPSKKKHLSQTLYRIPYADGTKVHINRDFYDHNPPGKIDMSGRGREPHRIVAAADGYIRSIPAMSGLRACSPVQERQLPICSLLYPEVGGHGRHVLCQQCLSGGQVQQHKRHQRHLRVPIGF